MKLLVLGMGRSGRAVASFCLKQGMPCMAFDDKKIESALPYPVFDALDASLYPAAGAVCVVSPGVLMSHPLLSHCRKLGILIISEVEFAYHMVKKDIPNMLAVTGTNGKTTVVMLLVYFLQRNSIRAEAIGNIGTPMSEAFSQPRSDCYVVEISSFQLMTTVSKMFSHAACLNISPNHLDWHSSMDEYRQAKLHLRDLVLPGGRFFLPDDFLVREVCERFRAAYPRAAAHEEKNFAAAFCLAQTQGVTLEEALVSYATFEKPRHRIEFVGTKDGITYYDDSKATNVAATMTSVCAIEGRVALIVGGVHKGSSYLPWKEAFGQKVFAVFAMGQAAAQIKEELYGSVAIDIVSSMDEAVVKASSFACKPYSVLLSPGCSSYDMFTDYKERGEKFIASVVALGGVIR